MHGAPALVLAGVSGYLAGSIPFGYLLVRLLRGIDLRTVGSGNTGATNAGRVLGRGGAWAVYVLDAAKGFAATRLLPPLVGAPESAAAVIGGAFAVVGHCFPVFLRFRGGKGVATGSGVLLALEPLAFAVGAAAWLALLAAFRYASLASIVMAFVYPVVVYARDPASALGARAPVFGASLAFAFLVLLRHRQNLFRLARGTEPRVGGK